MANETVYTGEIADVWYDPGKTGGTSAGTYADPYGRDEVASLGPDIDSVGDGAIVGVIDGADASYTASTIPTTVDYRMSPETRFGYELQGNASWFLNQATGKTVTVQGFKVSGAYTNSQGAFYNHDNAGSTLKVKDCTFRVTRDAAGGMVGNRGNPTDTILEACTILSFGASAPFVNWSGSGSGNITVFGCTIVWEGGLVISAGGTHTFTSSICKKIGSPVSITNSINEVVDTASSFEGWSDIPDQNTPILLVDPDNGNFDSLPTSGAITSGDPNAIVDDANTYWVGTAATGNGLGGDQDNVKAYVDQATFRTFVSTLSSGDRIIMRDGTYIITSGAAGDECLDGMTLKAENKHKAIFEIQSGFLRIGEAAGSGDQVVMDGMRVDVNAGAMFNSGRDVVFKNCFLKFDTNDLTGSLQFSTTGTKKLLVEGTVIQIDNIGDQRLFRNFGNAVADNQLRFKSFVLINNNATKKAFFTFATLNGDTLEVTSSVFTSPGGAEDFNQGWAAATFFGVNVFDNILNSPAPSDTVVIGDPLFIDTDSGNFDLLPTSPVITSGGDTLPADAVYVRPGSTTGGAGTFASPYQIEAASENLASAEADAALTTSKTIVFMSDFGEFTHSTTFTLNPSDGMTYTGDGNTVFRWTKAPPAIQAAAFKVISEGNVSSTVKDIRFLDYDHGGNTYHAAIGSEAATVPGLVTWINCEFEGDHVDGTNHTLFGAAVFANLANNTCVGCVFKQVAKSPGVGIGGGIAVNHTINFVGCIILAKPGSTTAQVSGAGDLPSGSAINTIWYSDALNFIHAQGTGQFITDRCVYRFPGVSTQSFFYATNFQEADPLFIDAENGNYNLLPTSPALT